MRARNVETGAVLAERVEVARTHLARLVGLLNRASLPEGEGLLLVPCRSVHTWGMRFPIDVVAIDANGVVVEAIGHLRPWRTCWPGPRTRKVLELPAGRIEATGTAAGQRIGFEDVGKGSTPA